MSLAGEAQLEHNYRAAVTKVAAVSSAHPPPTL